MFDWWFQLQELVISLQTVIDRTYYRAEFYNDILCTCLIKAPEPGEFITFSNSAMLRGIANSTRRRMEFFLNGKELSLNSVNSAISGNLINQ